MPATAGPFSPAQPCAFIYGDTVDCPSAWMHPGAIIIAGRVNVYSRPSFQAAAAAGATVLAYLNPLVNVAHGTYNSMIWTAGFTTLTAGGVTPRRLTLGTSYPFGDYRVQSQRDRLVSAHVALFEDLPWISGVFSDDLGSSKGASTPDASTWPTALNDAWFQGAVNAATDIRAVCDTYGKVTFHNGAWGAGSSFPNAGGYPNFNKHGCSLSDGYVIEHHDSQIGATPSSTYFWDAYIGEPGAGGPGIQWKKPGLGIVIASSSGGRQNWQNRNYVSHITEQPSDYDNPGPVWGSFHPINLNVTTGGGGGGGGGGGPTAAPAIPTGITVTPGNGQLTITWNANDPADQVDVYQVYVNDSLSAPSNLNVNGTTLTITGLTNGTSYNIRVSAHNAFNGGTYGNWSSIVSGTPSSGAPLAPTTFGASAPTGLNSTISATLPTDATRTSTVLVRKATPFVTGDVAGSAGVTTLATLSPGANADFPRSETVPSYGTYYYRLYTQNAGSTKTFAADVSVTYSAPVGGGPTRRTSGTPRTVAPSRRVP